MNTGHSADDRVLDLLAEQATSGLSSEDHSELQRLLREQPAIDPEQFELAAAAADLGLMFSEGAALEPMPAHLKRRVAAAARKRLPKVLQDRRGRWAAAGWYAAAAVLLAAVALSVLPRESGPAEPSLVEQFDRMVGTAPDLIRVPWTPPDDARFSDVVGEVAWSNATQSGFMRLSGMPVNDPAHGQYQLWIVDPSRDEHPIDGGVFDVASTGDVIVPIDAKLAVADPQAFAITFEQPGGVVVSAGPLLVVAAVTG